MIYFTPETSKKLEEMGLESTRASGVIYEWEFPELYPTFEFKGVIDITDRSDEHTLFSTLDICELENAKKLWGSVWQAHLSRDYITLSDEERVKYVEDYLESV